MAQETATLYSQWLDAHRQPTASAPEREMWAAVLLDAVACYHYAIQAPAPPGTPPIKLSWREKARREATRWLFSDAKSEEGMWSSLQVFEALGINPANFRRDIAAWHRDPTSTVKRRKIRKPASTLRRIRPKRKHRSRH